MALTRTFVRLLDKHGILKVRAFKRLTPSRNGLAWGVTFGLVGALCLAEPTSKAQEIPIITPYQYAKNILNNDREVSCLFAISKRESNTRFNAINRSSNALGAWQIINPLVANLTDLEQVEWAIRYAKHRYGSPCKAWEYWKDNYWW